MAISVGAAPHSAFLETSAGSFLIMHGMVTQNCNRKSSHFSVTIAKGEPGALAMASDGFDGSGVSILVNSVAGEGVLVNGEIDVVNVDFVGGTITVTGRDESGQLHQQKVSQKWQNQTGSQIVEQLAAKAGLGVSAIGSALMAGKKLDQDWIKLADNTPISYIINKLAEFDGNKWWVKNGIFNYAPFGTVSGSYTVRCTAENPVIGDTLRLHVRRNFQAGKNQEAKVQTWHPHDKQAYTGTADAPGNGGDLKSTFHLPGLDQSHVEQWAKAKVGAVTRHRTTVTATVAGDPSIDFAGSLTVVGTGVCDGTYEIDSITHNFGMSGYTMTIHAKTMGGNDGA